MSQYQYTKSANLQLLEQEIQASNIVTALDTLTSLGTTVTIIFKAALSNNDETTLDTIVSNHVNTPSPEESQLVRIDQPVDTDNRIMIRPTASKAGWVFSLIPIEFTTSKLDSLYSKKADNTNRTGITYKIYDNTDTEITDALDENLAVKTIIDFEPTFDYEIIGGQIQQKTIPGSDVRLWVIAVPDISEAYGGSKEMVGGVNLKYIDPTDKVQADGRVSKYMQYNTTYHTNKLRLMVRHSAGVQHDLLLVLEMFRA